MKRGDTIYLRRPRRLIRAVLVATYDWPAARVKVRGEEMIVGRAEVLSAKEVEAAKLEKLNGTVAAKHAALITRWRPGMTRAEWRDANGWNIGEWSAIRRLKRLGIIA